MLIVRPNLIETLKDLRNGASALRIPLEVRWRLDLDKQQRALMMLDNEINREVDGFLESGMDHLGQTS